MHEINMRLHENCPAQLSSSSRFAKSWINAT